MKKKRSGNSVDFARAAGSVGIAVFLSRILGLVREQVLATLFGASNQMDAFVVAFRIPNLLRDLFAEGALSSAFVTVFSEYDEQSSREETMRLVASVLAMLSVIVSIIVILGIVYSKEIVYLMAPEFQKVPGKIELTTTMTRIMFPFLLALSTASVFMGILNAKGNFFLPSMASAMFNISSIVVGGGLALYLPSHGVEGIIGMAIGTLVGGLAQMAIQLPPLMRIIEISHVVPQLRRFSIKSVVHHPGVKKVMKLMVPAIIGLSATQINIFVNTNFASRCPEGSVAWLNYSFRLILFPIGLFGVAISVVALPRFARKAANMDMKALGQAMVSSLELALVLTIPASIGLWVLSEEIVKLIFQRGHFHHYDTIMTAQALRFYSIGLFAYSCVKIVVPAFYAINDTKWPVAASFAAVAMNIVMVFTMLPLLQHRAIALSTSITIISNFLILASIFYKRIGGFPCKTLIKDCSKIVIASMIMGLVVTYLRRFINCDSGLMVEAVTILLVMAGGCGVYVILGHLMKITPLMDLESKIQKKME